MSTYSTSNTASVVFLKNSKFVVKQIHGMPLYGLNSQKYMTDKRKKMLSVTKSTDIMLRKKKLSNLSLI